MLEVLIKRDFMITLSYSSILLVLLQIMHLFTPDNSDTMISHEGFHVRQLS